jgi:peptidoglycan hydrolase-like protein with peptidoglycan-binding domain
MTIKLSKPFSPNSKVDEYDVRQIKKALNRLGYYQPYEKTGITGIPDREVFEALKEFQKDNGLRPTGETKPGDETIQTLDEEVTKIPDGYYIWRTVGDDKVRDSHAALDGAICAWSDSPTPGEDFNCRCWAESLPKNNDNCQESEKAWVNAGAKFFIAQQKLENAIKQKDNLEAQNIKNKSELSELNAQIEKEKADKRRAQNKGAAIGTFAGAIIGVPAGAGSSAGLAGVGIGLGSKTGRFVEEIGDAISSKNETDLTLGYKKQSLLKEMKETEKKIETISNTINNILKPEFQKAQQEENKTKIALKKCLSAKKD